MQVRGNGALAKTLLLAAVICGSLVAAPAKQDDLASYRRVAFVGTAIVKSTKGNVEYRAGEQWKTVAPGQTLACDSVCRTELGGQATFQMRSSGSLVRIGEMTAIRFTALDESMPIASLTGYQSSESAATVRAVRGNSEILQNHKWVGLKVGDVVQTGTPLRTGSETVVDLFFRDTGTVVRVTPKSQITVSDVPMVASGEVLTNRKTTGLLASNSK